MNPTLKVGESYEIILRGKCTEVRDDRAASFVFEPGEFGRTTLGESELAVAKITALPPEWKVGDRVRLRKGSRVFEIIGAPRQISGGTITEVAVWNDDVGYNVFRSPELERLP